MTLQIAGFVPTSHLTKRGSRLMRMDRQGFEVEVEANYTKNDKKRRTTGHTAVVYNRDRVPVVSATVSGSRGDAVDEAYTRWCAWRDGK